MTMTSHNKFDEQYLIIINDILKNGIYRTDRTDIGSIAGFSKKIDIDLSNGFPITTLRKVSLRIAFEELMFFLRGGTDTKILEDKKINIWKGNTSRNFLDGRKLTYLPIGNMGKGYGFQWRNFGGGYSVKQSHFYDFSTHDGCGDDQLYNLLYTLKNDPNSRRHIVIGWNPSQLNEMALAPCHLYNQYQILDGKLNSIFVMRSSDLIYGLPFNIISYALLNLFIASYLNIKCGILSYVGADVHIYNNLIPIANKLLTRKYYQSPSIILNKEINSLDDMLNIEYSDIKLIDYVYNPDFTNKPPMAI